MAAVGGIGVGGAGGGGGGGGGAAAAPAAPATPASFRLFFDELRIRINNFKLRFQTFDEHGLSLWPYNRSGPVFGKYQRLNDTVSNLEDPLNLRSLPEVILVQDQVVIGLLAFKKEDDNTWILDVNTYQSNDYEDDPSQYISTVSYPLNPSMLTPFSFQHFTTESWSHFAQEEEKVDKVDMYTRSLGIPLVKKAIIGPSMRNEINISIGIQELRNYQDAITQQEVLAKHFSKEDEYVVLNLAPNPATNPSLALGPPATWKESIKRFTILTTDSLLLLALSALPFQDPRTRNPITSVTKLVFNLDTTTVVNPRQQLELARVQDQGRKRPRSESLGGGKIKRKRKKSKSKQSKHSIRRKL